MLVCIGVFNLNCWSQEKVCHKIAHVDVEYVLSEWQAVRRVDSIIYQEKMKAEKNFRPVFDRYQSLYQKISDKQFTGIELENKLLELEQLEAQVNNYNANLKNTLVAQQEELMKPLFTQLKTTINTLASEGDYDYVLSSVSGETSIVLYYKSEGDDLTQAVLQRIHQE